MEHKLLDEKEIILAGKKCIARIFLAEKRGTKYFLPRISRKHAAPKLQELRDFWNSHHPEDVAVRNEEGNAEDYDPYMQNGE